MIKAAQFSIFDVTGWNPNVTLELGLAYGYNEKVYIAFNPKLGASNDIPSDLGGIDRIQYVSYTEFEKKLAEIVLLRQ